MRKMNNTSLLFLFLLGLSLYNFSPWMERECTLQTPSDIGMHYGLSMFLRDSIKQGNPLPGWSHNWWGGSPLFLWRSVIPYYFPTLLGLFTSNFNLAFYLVFALFFVFTCMAFYLLASEYLGKELAFLAAVILATTQRIYSVITLWGQFSSLAGFGSLILCAYFLLRFQEGRNKKNLLFASISFLLCAASHLFVFYFLCLLISYFFIIWLLKKEWKTIGKVLVFFFVALGVLGFQLFPLAKNLHLWYGPEINKTTSWKYKNQEETIYNPDFKKIFTTLISPDLNEPFFDFYLPPYFLVIGLIGAVICAKKMKNVKNLFLVYWMIISLFVIVKLPLPIVKDFAAERAVSLLPIPLIILSLMPFKKKPMTPYLAMLPFLLLIIVFLNKIFKITLPVVVQVIVHRNSFVIFLAFVCILKTIPKIIKKKLKKPKQDRGLLAYALFFSIIIVFYVSTTLTRFWCIYCPSDFLEEIRTGDFMADISLVSGDALPTITKTRILSGFFGERRPYKYNYFTGTESKPTAKNKEEFLEFAEEVGLAKIVVHQNTQEDVEKLKDFQEIFRKTTMYLIEWGQRKKGPVKMNVFVFSDLPINNSMTISSETTNVTKTKTENEKITIKYSAEKETNITVKINYFPYWKAKLSSGEEIQTEADTDHYSFIKLVGLPKGEHEVVIEYKNKADLLIGFLISIISLFLLVFLFKRVKYSFSGD